MQAALRGSVARLSQLKRPWCGATDAAATFVPTSVLHDPRWHEGRPLGGGAKDGGLLGRSGFVDVVRQLRTLEHFQRAAFLGSHLTALGCWQAGGVVTVTSQRAGQAGFAWHFDAGAALAAQGMGRRPVSALPRRPRHNVPPLLRVPGPANRSGHARLIGGAAGGTFSCAAIQGTVRTRIFHSPACGTTGP